jgi:glycosyltransferase involved in cell wall biosynthesis
MSDDKRSLTNHPCGRHQSLIGTEAMIRIAYLVPEFPGQTHIFFWREIAALHQRGIGARLISSRHPPRTMVCHSWAAAAEAKTTYLGEMNAGDVLAAVIGFVRCGPIGWFRSVAAAISSCPFGTIPRNLALLLCAARLVEILKRENLSHIHVHSCGDLALVAALANRLAGSRYSLTLHGPLSDYRGQQHVKFRHAAFVIAITHHLKESIRKALGRDAPRSIGVAPMGVDPLTFCRTAPFQPWTGGRLVLFSCGRLTPGKGHQDLIAAVSSLRENGIDAHLSIAGEDDVGGSGYHTELAALIGRLGLKNQVDLLGAVSEDRVLEELRHAHLFVLASHCEPLGVAIMEALSCGTPVIATDAGGVPEIIDHDHNGYLVAPKRADMLADAILTLISDPDLQRRFSVAGRTTAVERFNSGISADELKDLLSTAANGDKRAEQPDDAAQPRASLSSHRQTK